MIKLFIYLADIWAKCLIFLFMLIGLSDIIIENNYQIHPISNIIIMLSMVCYVFKDYIFYILKQIKEERNEKE